jgi:hypothetical protein
MQNINMWTYSAHSFEGSRFGDQDSIWRADSSNISDWRACEKAWYEGGNGELLLIRAVDQRTGEPISGFDVNYSGTNANSKHTSQSWVAIWVPAVEHVLRITGVGRDSFSIANIHPCVDYVVKVIVVFSEVGTAHMRPSAVYFNSESTVSHCTGGVWGSVRDVDLGFPIAGVSFILGDSRVTAVSDSSGMFKIRSNVRGVDSVRISHPEYYATTVQIAKRWRNSRLELMVALCRLPQKDQSGKRQEFNGAVIATAYSKWSSKGIGRATEEGPIAIKVQRVNIGKGISPATSQFLGNIEGSIILKSIVHKDVVSIQVLNMVGSGEKNPNSPNIHLLHIGE